MPWRLLWLKYWNVFHGHVFEDLLVPNWWCCFWGGCGNLQGMESPVGPWVRKQAFCATTPHHYIVSSLFSASWLPTQCNQLLYIPTGVESASMSHSHTGSTSNHDQKQPVLPWIVPGSFAPTAYAWLIKRWVYAVVTALSPLTPCTGHKDSADSVQSPTNTILQSSVWRSLLTLSLRTWLFFSPSVFVRF